MLLLLTTIITRHYNDNMELIPIIITILGILWVGYETSWQYRIILSQKSCLTPELYLAQASIIRAELASSAIDYITSMATDNATALQWAQIELEHLELELNGRGSPFGRGFAKGKGKGAISRPYQELSYEQLQAEHDAVQWYETIIREYLEPVQELPQDDIDAYQDYKAWDRQRSANLELETLNYGHYRR